jgi:DNA-binding protein HU-beta
MRRAFPFFFCVSFARVDAADSPDSRLTRGFSPCYKARPGITTRKNSSVFGLRADAGFCISHQRISERGCSVNKFELIEAIAKSADISKAAAGRALDGAVAAIQVSLKKGSMVTLVGFGTFYVGKRAARSGRNPRTGAAIKIKAAKVPKFRAGKALKDAVN